MSSKEKRNELLAHQRNQTSEKTAVAITALVLMTLKTALAEVVEGIRNNKGIIIPDWFQKQLLLSVRDRSIAVAQDTWDIVGNQYGWVVAEDDDQVTPLLTGIWGANASDSFYKSQVPLRVSDRVREMSHRHKQTFTEKIENKFNKNIEKLGTIATATKIKEEITKDNLSYSKLVGMDASYWASNEGAMGRFINEGVQYFEWFATKDEKRCVWCNQLHGETIRKGEPFKRRGDVLTYGERHLNAFPWDIYHSPLHNHCRCILIPKN